jgi:molybdenum cofactor cytidylyltransferase
MTTYKKIAGIILAAGDSGRFGQPKQLLDWHGQTLIHFITQIAIDSGLSPILVVTGSEANDVARAVSDLHVITLYNLYWRKGQSTSLRTAIEVLPDDIDAVIIFLADQPFVSPALVEAIINCYKAKRGVIVIPYIGGQRANPVLFDLETFQDLLSVKGDKGGRAIFKKYPITPLQWHDKNLLIDIDTIDDYNRFHQIS